MSHSINRKQLLSGDLTGAKRPFRPPWAKDEAQFTERCTSCGDCLSACPEALIEFGRGRLPQMNFTQGACDFCRACVDACKPGALVHDPAAGQAPWRIKARIDETCLSLNGVICRSCAEVCEERAIRFKLELGGVARPVLESEQCSGCGACFGVCPSHSIQLYSIKHSCEQAA